ncbi:S-layer homology domain-containing protein [Candidatus Peregrinibacteria bacterium]|nr:S-layer homology domain-containing protein [Candidatus Peregrinibacteria bacterium]
MAHAAVFPDVPDGHSYRAAIELLVGLEVINGNPDGNFYPSKNVNRAEMLKMLYKAAGREPAPLYRDCFGDVEEGSWYELYVCDAEHRGFVQGYNDGYFRPANLVNRVEALKMIAEVFGVPIAEFTERDREILKFVDVSVSAWYTKHLSSAFKLGILPVAGQDGPRFYPDWPLLRGEAAAYITNALAARDRGFVSALPQPEERTPREPTPPLPIISSSSSLPAGPSDITTFDEVFPFSKSAVFTSKESHTYRFTLTGPVVADIEAELQVTGETSCRLYRLGEGGFSLEYYLGYQEGSRCFILVALDPGSYQLQLQGNVTNASYTLVVHEGRGDSHDGFREAKILSSIPRTETLTANDYADWYFFKVLAERTTLVELSTQDGVGCLVYPMEDVDLYGFSGPECNKEYTYPPGTYYVGVNRVPPRAAKLTYTIRLK